MDARSRALSPLFVTAEPYPGFPTDLHPQMAAFLATVPGESRIVDRVFPQRTAYLPELARLGARLTWESDLADFRIGGGPLSGGEAHVTDLRAGGALVIAALAATGTSAIVGVEHLERGYQDLERKLATLGATLSLKA